MQRFKNILVVVDTESMTSSVLERARWLAQANDARLTLVDVIDTEPGELARTFAALPGRRARQLEAEVLELHRTRLSEVAVSLINDGLSVETVVLHGTGFIQIIRHVLKFGHDLVVKAAQRGPDRPFLRAPDLHLLRKCPCPVWILNGESDAKSARIMAAVDPDLEDQSRDALNQMVMQLATSLSQQDGAKLDVVNAWHVQEEATLSHSLIKMKPEEIAAILTHEERLSKARLDRLMAGFTDFAPFSRVLHLKGIAADVIPDHVETESIDTLVMGTLGRTGISGFFIGNTAETILNRVSCSVLAVKPQGFVSPVTLEGEE